MKKNIILSGSLISMQILRILISLFAAIHVLIVVGFFINDLPMQEITSDFQSLIYNSKSGLQIQEFPESQHWLSFLLIVQSLSTLALLFSILGYGIDIIRNIGRKKTFTDLNIEAFDKVSQLAVILFFLQLLKLSPGRIGLAIEFNYLFMAFGAIILAEVFKEGHRLLEENELTV
ncbi:Protein of unknown function [Marivirga sericea]|uniref:DUF2975 domain-containing protein n=1 Tax=Marivirga sericea TaxID=1028 RepID=A0A1X7LFC5_9BACT|nr:DUF2975 domain-containing protein [Marivirga sericea]SMG52566.1 Protein of unknown function [Marivirga sericea]